MLSTPASEVFLLRPTEREDERGRVRFMWDPERWSAATGVYAPVFVMENHLRSHRGVLRGIHVQRSRPQGKLVRCLRGRVFDVAVDLRRGSPGFGTWVGAELDAALGAGLWVPPGFGHGVLVLEDDAEISILATDRTVPAEESTLRWDDPALAIEWPLPDGLRPILSARDRAGDELGAFA